MNGQEIAPELEYDSAEDPSIHDDMNDLFGKRDTMRWASFLPAKDSRNTLRTLFEDPGKRKCE